MAAPTSFKKRVNSKIRQIPGTKPSLFNNQLLISTGIPSLDNVLGGGLAVGTVLLVEEDMYAKHAHLMMKYFCAEGVVSGHAVSIVSVDHDPNRLMQNLPAPIGESGSGIEQAPPSQGPGDGEDKMSIAWRYQNKPKVQPAPSAQFGHYFNLTQRMDALQLSSADIRCVGFSDLLTCEGQKDKTSSVPTCMYQHTLRKIRNRIKEGSFGTAVKNESRNILRIGILGLGSALWGEEGGSSHYGEQVSLLRFLLALRATLRTAFAVCLVTVPVHLFHEIALLKRAEHLCDTVVKLESFAASEKKKNPAFRDYSGLFHLVKVPCLNELVPRMPDTLDLAFRMRRKKFTIEKLHLPPELSDTAGREQDDLFASVKSSSGCSVGGTGSSKLDF